MPYDTSHALGARLRRLRGKRTHQQLAERAGLNWRTIYKLESGERRNPNSETLAKLARALGVTTDELLSGAAPRSPAGGARRQ